MVRRALFTITNWPRKMGNYWLFTSEVKLFDSNLALISGWKIICPSSSEGGLVYVKVKGFELDMM